MRTLCVGIFAATSVLFGQLDSNSIVVTAYRSVYLQPDHAEFLVNVVSPPNATLDNIVGALQGSGITATSLSGRSEAFVSPPGVVTAEPPQITWSFNLTTPLASINNTLASLTTIQQSITQKNSGLSIYFGVVRARVSPQSQESQQCPIADLVSDARNQAQTLAAAAGLTLGPILAIYDGSTRVFAVLGSAVAVAQSPVSSSALFTTPSLTCAITVKFTLLRYQ